MAFDWSAPPHIRWLVASTARRLCGGGRCGRFVSVAAAPLYFFLSGERCVTCLDGLPRARAIGAGERRGGHGAGDVEADGVHHQQGAAALVHRRIVEHRTVVSPLGAVCRLQLRHRLQSKFTPLENRNCQPGRNKCESCTGPCYFKLSGPVSGPRV
eukprot:1193585-Prorocentrum_minimum.AAC.1